MANEPVLPLARCRIGGSFVMMLIRHGTPWEKYTWTVAFTPYARDPVRRVSAEVVNVSWLPETV